MVAAPAPIVQPIFRPPSAPGLPRFRDPAVGSQGGSRSGRARGHAGGRVRACAGGAREPSETPR